MDVLRSTWLGCRGSDELNELRGRCAPLTAGSAGAVQHRRGRLRQASADKLAMIWESSRRPRARVGRAPGSREPGRAHSRGTESTGRPGRGRPAADAGDRRLFFGRVEARRDPALDVRAVRRRRDRASARGLGRGAARHRRRQTRRASTGRGRRSCSYSSRAPWRGPDRVLGDTAADDPAQLYYTSGTTGLAKGIVHAHRYILGHEEFGYCHEVKDGERFHGMGEWAWAAGIAPLLGPWRLGAVQCVYRREAVRPAPAARLPQPAR